MDGLRIGGSWAEWVKHSDSATAEDDLCDSGTGSSSGDEPFPHQTRQLRLQPLSKLLVAQYSHAPEFDKFRLVKCPRCLKMIKLQIFASHCSKRHGLKINDALLASSVPSLSPVTGTPESDMTSPTAHLSIPSCQSILYPFAGDFIPGKATISTPDSEAVAERRIQPVGVFEKFGASDISPDEETKLPVSPIALMRGIGGDINENVCFQIPAAVFEKQSDIESSNLSYERESMQSPPLINDSCLPTLLEVNHTALHPNGAQPGIIQNTLPATPTQNQTLDCVESDGIGLPKIESVDDEFGDFADFNLPEDLQDLDSPDLSFLDSSGGFDDFDSVIDDQFKMQMHPSHQNCSPAKSPKSRCIKKSSGAKVKAFDPDRHCGVRFEKNGEWIQCTRSITCKSHTLSLRKAVPGRSRPLVDILADIRNEKKLKKEQELAALGFPSTCTTISSGANQLLPNDSSANPAQFASTGGLERDLQRSFPYATCDFGARRLGATRRHVFDHRSSTFRRLFSKLLLSSTTQSPSSAPSSKGRKSVASGPKAPRIRSKSSPKKQLKVAQSDSADDAFRMEYSNSGNIGLIDRNYAFKPSPSGSLEVTRNCPSEDSLRTPESVRSTDAMTPHMPSSCPQPYTGGLASPILQNPSVGSCSLKSPIEVNASVRKRKLGAQQPFSGAHGMPSPQPQFMPAQLIQHSPNGLSSPVSPSLGMWAGRTGGVPVPNSPVSGVSPKNLVDSPNVSPPYATGTLNVAGYSPRPNMRVAQTAGSVYEQSPTSNNFPYHLSNLHPQQRPQHFLNQRDIRDMQSSPMTPELGYAQKVYHQMPPLEPMPPSNPGLPPNNSYMYPRTVPEHIGGGSEGIRYHSASTTSPGAPVHAGRMNEGCGGGQMVFRQNYQQVLPSSGGPAGAPPPLLPAQLSPSVRHCHQGANYPAAAGQPIPRRNIHQTHMMPAQPQIWHQDFQSNSAAVDSFRLQKLSSNLGGVRNARDGMVCDTTRVGGGAIRSQESQVMNS